MLFFRVYCCVVVLMCVCVCVCVQGSRSEVFLGGSLGVESAQQKDEQAFVARVNTAKSVHVVSVFRSYQVMDKMSKKSYLQYHFIMIVRLYNATLTKTQTILV